MRFREIVLRLSVATRLAIVLAVVLMASSAAVAWWSSRIIDAAVTASAVQAQNSSMKLAAHLLRQALPAAVLEEAESGVSRIRLASVPDMPDHALVDAVTHITGGVTTVFRWDAARGDFVRISTTVKRPDGSRAIGTVLGVNNPVFAVVRGGRPYLGEATILGLPYQTKYVPILGADGQPNGLLFVGLRNDAVDAIQEPIINGVLTATVVAGIIAILVAMAFLIRAMKPVTRLGASVRGLAAGELDVAVPDTERRDAAGEVARALERLRLDLLDRAQLQQEESERHQRDSERGQRLAEISRELSLLVDRSAEQVMAGASDLTRGIDTLREAAGVTASQVSHVTSASAHSADGVRVAASAAEELNSVISEISGQVTHGSRVTAEAVEAMGRTSQLVTTLDTSSARIGEVITLITTIADQTNLLALNATIEAARAGEAGRGFAVVAQEVKALSAQTAKATDEIRRHVDEMQTATREAVNAMDGIGKIIGSIDRITLSIAGAVEQQSSATGQIAQSISEASQASSSVADSMAQVEAASRSSAAAAESLEQTARSVLAAVNALKAGALDHVAAIRAA